MALLWAHVMMLQCILMLLQSSFIMYYYTQLWYLYVLLVNNIIKTNVAQHKNKNQFMMNPCLEIRYIVFVKGYFIHLSDSWNIPTQKTIHLDLRTRIHHSRVFVIGLEYYIIVLTIYQHHWCLRKCLKQSLSPFPQKSNMSALIINKQLAKHKSIILWWLR